VSFPGPQEQGDRKEDRDPTLSVPSDEREYNLEIISGIDNPRAQVVELLEENPAGLHMELIIKGTGLSEKTVYKVAHELADINVVTLEQGPSRRIIVRLNTRSPIFSIRTFLKHLRDSYERRAREKPNSFTNKEYAGVVYMLTSQIGHIFLKRTLAIINGRPGAEDFYNEIFVDAVRACDQVLKIVRDHIVEFNPTQVNVYVNQLMTPGNLSAWLEQLYRELLELESSAKKKRGKVTLAQALKLALEAYMPVLSQEQVKELTKMIDKYERQPIEKSRF